MSDFTLQATEFTRSLHLFLSSISQERSEIAAFLCSKEAEFNLPPCENANVLDRMKSIIEAAALWKEKYLMLREKFASKARDWREFKQEFEKMKRQKRGEIDQESESGMNNEEKLKMNFEEKLENYDELNGGKESRVDDELNGSRIDYLRDPFSEAETTQEDCCLVMNTFTDLSLSQLRRMNMENYVEEEGEGEGEERRDGGDGGEKEEEREKVEKKEEKIQADCECCAQVPHCSNQSLLKALAAVI